MAERESILDGVSGLQADVCAPIPDVAPLCDTIPGLRRRVVDIDDARLYCEEEGAGPPLVTIHGGVGGTHHVFHPTLSQAAGFARVIYYDQRGCGQSDYSPGAGWSVDQAVDDLEQLRLRLGVGPWALLGTSYGAFLAQVYATRHPASVTGMLLMSAMPASDLHRQPGARQKHVSKEEREQIQAIHSDADITLAERVYNAFRNGDWKRQYFYRLSDDEMARVALHEWCHDPEYRRAMWQVIDSIDLAEAFETCPIPTLIIEGEFDTTWHASKAEKFRAMHPNAEYVMVERAGHAIERDQPERLIEVLHGWLQQLTPAVDSALWAWHRSLSE